MIWGSKDARRIAPCCALTQFCQPFAYHGGHAPLYAINFFTLAWSNIKIMMPYELLRAVHLRNSASHAHIMGPLPHFMLMSGRVQKSDVPIRASTRGHRLFHPGIIIIKKI